jgi:NTE family protein
MTIETRKRNIRKRKRKESMSSNNNTIPKPRVLVLQGGVALGAYEAGAFRVLYQKLTREDEKNGEKNRPLFDIVAGTSIGAINAAILVSHVVEKRKANSNIGEKESWEGSAEKLVDFWKYISVPTPNIVNWPAQSTIIS